MKRLACVFVLFAAMGAAWSVTSERDGGAMEDLNGVRGKIFRVDVEERSFDLLKETVFDPKTESIVDDPEANKLLRREYEPGFEVPELA